MAKTKYEDRTRQQIAADEAKEKGLFGAIGSYLSGKTPRSESMDDPQGRSNRRRKGMAILKQRQAEGERRAAELKRKKEQELRKAKAARVLAQRKKEGEERAARLKKQKEEQIARRRAAPAVAKAAGQATGETAKQAAMAAATKPASKAPDAKTPASKTPAPKPKAPAAKPAANTSSRTSKPAAKSTTTSSTPASSGPKWKQYKSLAAAKKANSRFYMGSDGKKKLAITKEELGRKKGETLTQAYNRFEGKKPVKKMGGGMMKSKMASKGGARGGRRAMGMKNGGFPDLTGDGKVTQADILKGRGVAKKKAGGMMKSKGYAKGGAMKKKGYSMGGAVKKKPTKPRGVGAALRGYGKAGR